MLRNLLTPDSSAAYCCATGSKGRFSKNSTGSPQQRRYTEESFCPFVFLVSFVVVSAHLQPQRAQRPQRESPRCPLADSASHCSRSRPNPEADRDVNASAHNFPARIRNDRQSSERRDSGLPRKQGAGPRGER